MMFTDRLGLELRPAAALLFHMAGTVTSVSLANPSVTKFRFTGWAAYLPLLLPPLQEAEPAPQSPVARHGPPLVQQAVVRRLLLARWRWWWRVEELEPAETSRPHLRNERGW